MDPRDSQAKYNKLGVHSDILVVHEENQFRVVFITENKFSTVTYVDGTKYKKLAEQHQSQVSH